MKAPAVPITSQRMDGLWVSYGVGHFGKSLMWHSSELLFAFYLTEVCGMAPRVMATVIALSLFVSGLMDILVGHVLRARTGTVYAAAVQAVGACCAGIMFFLFLVIAFLPASQHVFVALVVGLVFRLAYAFYDVPQNAVLGLAYGGTSLRAGLSSLRFICSGLAALSIAAAAAFLLTETPRTQSFAVLGAGVAVTAIGTALLFLWRARATAERVANLLPGAAATGAMVAPGAHGRKPMAGLLCLGFGISASSVIFMKLEPYFAASALTTTVARATLMSAVACGGILSQLFTAWGATRWHLTVTSRLCALAVIIGALTFVTVGTGNTAQASAAGFLIGFGLNGLGMLLWTAVANLANALAQAPSPLAPTVAFGLLTCAQKCASALGILIVGAMLDWRDNVVESAERLFPIVLAMGVAPMLGAIVCLVFAASLEVQIETPRVRVASHKNR